MTRILLFTFKAVQQKCLDSQRVAQGWDNIDGVVDRGAHEAG